MLGNDSYRQFQHVKIFFLEHKRTVSLFRG